MTRKQAESEVYALMTIARVDGRPDVPTYKLSGFKAVFDRRVRERLGQKDEK